MMKTILMLACFIFSALQVAHADQCTKMDKQYVNIALSHLKIGAEFVEFCGESCGEENFPQFQHFYTEVIDTLKVEKADKKQWTIRINDSSFLIDPTDIYIKKDALTFLNVSNLAGCESDDVVKVYSIEKLSPEESEKKYTPKVDYSH